MALGILGFPWISKVFWPWHNSCWPGGGSGSCTGQQPSRPFFNWGTLRIPFGKIGVHLREP